MSKHLFFLALLTACGTKDSSSTSPTGTTPTTGSTPAGTLPTTGSGTGSGTGTGAGTGTGTGAGTGTGTGAGTGTGTGAGTGTGTGSTGSIVATLDAWCEPEERVALVELTDWGTKVVMARVWDQTHPQIRPPALDDGTCAFYERHVDACGTCATGTLCAPSGSCVPAPTLEPATLVVRDTRGGSESFGAGTSNAIDGTLGLAGDIEVELQFGSHTVTTPLLNWPDALTNTTRTARGVWDAPGETTLTWDTTDKRVYANIPMNHHAPGPSFTECHFQGSAGSGIVPAAMIDPLAVITGLEFQTLDHTVHAAADTSDGCVEFRLRVPAFPLYTGP